MSWHDEPMGGADFGIFQVPSDGTVGAVLSKPVPPSLLRRSCVVASTLGGALVFIGMSRLAVDDLIPGFPSLASAYPALSDAFVACGALGVVFLLCSLVLLAFESRFSLSKVDLREQTRRAILQTMLRDSRFSVGLNTKVSDVRVRCFPTSVRGAWRFSCPLGFSPRDFDGVRPEDMAAFDFEVESDGRLLVFYSEQSKRDFALMVRRGKHAR